MFLWPFMKKLRQQFTTLMAAIKAAFPHVEPLDTSWWIIGLNKYPFGEPRTSLNLAYRKQNDGNGTQTSENP